MMTRRRALKTTALGAVACAAMLPRAIAQSAPSASAITEPQPGPFTLPPLPYPYDALEPHIDARTMEIHHDKHHAGYVANLNKALYENRQPGSVEDLLRHLNRVPEAIRTTVRNNGGGHYNHSLFWNMMKKNGGGRPKGDLASALDKRFGSFDRFQEEFSKAAAGQFGSGWAWLIRANDGLDIVATPNQDNPISRGLTPLLGIDVWEHAYYLKYQNRRADYIKAWFNVVNWDYVAERFARSA